MTKEESMRKFETGATRNVDSDKIDFEGFLSPVVLKAYAEYLHKHRIQADGKLRDSDNWQKGIPKTVYMKSLWRHFYDLWMLHRGYQVSDSLSGMPITIKEAASAVMFNVMGYLFEDLREHSEKVKAAYTEADAKKYSAKVSVGYLDCPRCDNTILNCVCRVKEAVTED